MSALIDGDLQVVLAEPYPGDPTLNYVPAYRFALKRAGNSNPIGEIELRIGHTPDLIKYGGHIAYGVNAPHLGNRYAARACKRLFPLARAHGLTEVWITCNPDNTASRRTCELAGGGVDRDRRFTGAARHVSGRRTSETPLSHRPLARPFADSAVDGRLDFCAKGWLRIYSL